MNTSRRLWYRLTHTRQQLRYSLLTPIIGLLASVAFALAGRISSESMLVALAETWRIDDGAIGNVVSYLRLSFLLIMLSSAVVAIAQATISILWSRRVFGPAVPILNHVRRLREGQFDSKITLRRHDEFQEIADELNALAKELKEGRTNQRGFSLIEILIALAIMGVVAAAFTSLMTTMQLENRSVQDKIEAADIERQMGTLLADDALCRCNVVGSPAIAADATSPTSPGAGLAVELNTIYTNYKDKVNCATPTETFATRGQKMAAISASFKVSRIALRDLRPTGRRDASSGQLNEYTGGIYVEFDSSQNPSRALRPIKVSKLFTTNASGRNIISCAAPTDNFREGDWVVNGPGLAKPAAAKAWCPAGYVVRSGGWKTSGSPTCPKLGVDPKPPLILESRPAFQANGTQGWLVTGTCITIKAVAVCQRVR